MITIDILKALLEIALLWVFYYWLLIFFRGSMAFLVLRGAVVLFVVFVIANLLGLSVLSWLFTKVVPLMAISFIVVFQPELRRGLAQIGGEAFLRFAPRREEVVEQIVKGVEALSRRKIGAILAVEGRMSLTSYAQSGVLIDAAISSELLQTVFMQGTPLHDGGVVITQGRMVASACLFPLSQNPRLSKTMGTRHRAALGVSEETDALIVVVSEETGTVSLAIKGELQREVGRDELARALYGAIGTRPRMESLSAIFANKAAAK